MPLNVICVTDLQRICNQCALNNLHLDHQIIKENKFIEYVDELVKVFQTMESNKNLNIDMSNIDTNIILEKLLYVQEGSFNNGDNKSINEMYNMLNLSNSDILFNEADDDDDENTVSNEERKNIKLLQNNTDEDLAEPIPDIMPTYQTQFINGFIKKI